MGLLELFPSLALVKDERYLARIFIQGLIKKLLPIVILTLSIVGLLIAIDITFERAISIEEQKKALGYAYQQMQTSLNELSSLLSSTGQRLRANLTYAQKRRILEDSLRSTDPCIHQGTLYWAVTKPKFQVLSHYGVLNDIPVGQYHPFLKELKNSSQTMAITLHEGSFYCGQAFCDNQEPVRYLIFRLPYEALLKPLQERYPSIRILRECDATTLPISRSTSGLLDGPYEYEGVQFNAFIRLPGLLFLLADSHAFDWRIFLNRNRHHFGLILLMGFLACLYAASNYRRGYAHVKGKLHPIIKNSREKEAHHIEHIATLERDNKALMRRQHMEEQAYKAEKDFITVWVERRQEMLQEITEKLGEAMQEMRMSSSLTDSDKTLALIAKALMDVSTLATGSLNNDHPTSVDLRKIIQRALDILMHETEAFAHEIQQLVPPDLTAVIIDEVFCLLLITNLLYQAIERTPRRGAICIQIEETPDKRALRVIIEDTGFRNTLIPREHKTEACNFLRLSWKTLEAMAHHLQGRLTHSYQGLKGNRIELLLPLTDNEDPYKDYNNVVRLF